MPSSLAAVTPAVFSLCRRDFIIFIEPIGHLVCVETSQTLSNYR